MNARQNASRITDVVPANFLCDNQAMQKIADSQVLEENALLALEENLSVLESRKRRLNDELESVERLISEAVAEQTRLRASIETHKSLLTHSPVRALPGEVLSEIFLYYIALSQTAQKNVFKEIVASHRIHAPILLVCRRWRSTALADPRLWTTIPFIGSGGEAEEKAYEHPLTSESPAERAAYWKALQSRIKKTSALPLRLLYHIAQNGYMPYGNYAEDSMLMCVHSFSRAYSISLHIQFRDYSFPDLKYLMDAVDIPHAGAVHTARVNVIDNNVFAHKVLLAIPNVEVLETRSEHIDRWLISAPTAGHCLRSLHILTHWQSAMPLVQILDILDRAPLLETLTVPRISFTSSVGTLRVVTHTRLSTFHITTETAGENSNNAVFRHLTLPALRSLSYVSADYSPQLWPRPSNVAFVQRSGCMLESLAFRRCRVSKTRLMELLTLQPALVTLHLNYFDGEGGGKQQPIPMAILEFLSSESKDGSDRPLPALKVLTVMICPEQLGAVKKLVQSRSGEQAKKCRTTTLRQVHILVLRKDLMTTRIRTTIPFSETRMQPCSRTL